MSKGNNHRRSSRLTTTTAHSGNTFELVVQPAQRCAHGWLTRRAVHVDSGIEFEVARNYIQAVNHDTDMLFTRDLEVPLDVKKDWPIYLEFIAQFLDGPQGMATCPHCCNSDSLEVVG